jgi:glutaconyl-CoA/methylmalonyl-CoA decarboxylase subunit gamma
MPRKRYLESRGWDAVLQYEVEINGRLRQVTVHRVDGRFVVAIDRREWVIDAARIDAHTWSLLIDEDVRTCSHEVTLAADAGSGALNVRVGGAAVAVCVNGRRRLGRKADGPQAAGSGPLRIVAPMPGKIVRVLVRTGEVVHAHQPLIVIEAMKMENELRAAGSGTVADIQVTDGQSVEAGALLAVIHR